MDFLTGLLRLLPEWPLPLLLVILLSLRSRARFWCLLLGTGVLLASMTTAWTGMAMRWLEGPVRVLDLSTPAKVAELTRNHQAIVILGGGLRQHAGEWPGDSTLKPLSLERVRYGAHLARLTGLPVLVTGGSYPGAEVTEAAVMKQVLVDEFRLDASQVHLEDAARDTAENARFTAQKMAGQGWQRVVLVTQAYHMPRSSGAFSAAGVAHTPAPMGYRQRAVGVALEGMDFFPRWDGMQATFLLSHETVGQIWYRLRQAVPSG